MPNRNEPLFTGRIDEINPLLQKIAFFIFITHK